MVLHLNADGELVEDTPNKVASPPPKKKESLKSSSSSGSKKVVPDDIAQQFPEIVDARGIPCDLHTLVARGDQEGVIELLEAGYEVGGRDGDNATPLHHAAFNGRKEIIKILLKAGADINSKDKDGVTPLHHASFNGSKDCIKLLIKNKANVNAKDRYGGTPIHNACYNGQLSSLTVLTDKGGDFNAKDGDKSTPLHYAAFRGKPECVKFLLDKKVEIDAQDKEGTSPLHHACLNGHKDVTKMLLDAGAKTDVKDHLGGTALIAATYNQHEDCIKLLLSKKDSSINIKDHEGATALHKAAFLGDIKSLKMLIEKGADVKIQDDEGATALHKASFQGFVEAVEVLLKAGAPIDLADLDGGTPLINAIYNGHVGVASVLIEKGAHIDISDKEGRTPLHNAACFGLRECFTLLIEKGAKIDSKDFEGITPMHMAAFNGQNFALSILIDKGADVNAKSSQGSTPLHYASYKGHLSSMVLLVSKGAQVNAVDAKGITPIQSASVCPSTDNLAYLVYKGAKVNEYNKFGMGALHYSVNNQFARNAYFLMEKGADLDAKDKKGVSPREAGKKSEDEDIKEIFRFIEAEKKPFSAEAKARLWETIDERKENLQQVNAEIEGYDSAMNPEVSKRQAKTNNAFQKFGFNFDVNDAVDIAAVIEKEAGKLSRANTFLNIMRHLLLIPTNTAVANKIWTLLEVFIHRAVILRDENDDSEDVVRIKFNEWRKFYQNKNKIDEKNKLWVLSGIEEALTILFPSADFEHATFLDEEEDNFDPDAEETVTDDKDKKKPGKLGKKAEEDDEDEEEDEDEDEDDEELDEDEKKKKKENKLPVITGGFDLSAIKFDDDEPSRSDFGGGVPPPPPPPGMDGGMPPPPPPPGGFGGPPPPPPPGMGLGDKSKIKLKRFNWDKIPNGRIRETFWKGVKTDGIKLDRKVLEKHFFVKDKSMKEASTVKKSVQLVDLQRANNVGILLSRFKASPTEIKNAINVLDEKTLTLDNTRALLRLAPSPDEIEMLKNYKGEKESLGNAEKFFMELMEIPRVQVRLECFVYKREFAVKAEELRDDIRFVNTASRSVGMSKKLKQMLQIVLVIGNNMNQGSFGGQAQGFKVSSVLKLKDTKSDTGKFTLLHYLISLLEEKKPELCTWPEEIGEIKPGNKERINTIVAELSVLKKGMELITTELKEVKSGDPFKKQIGDFQTTSQQDLDRLEEEVKDMQKGFDDLAVFFGEEPGVDVPQAVAEFAVQFNAAYLETSEAKATAKRAAAKKMEASKITKRKGLVEKTAKIGKNAKALLGASHVEMRKKLQKNRVSRTKRDTRPEDMPSGGTVDK